MMAWTARQGRRRRTQSQPPPFLREHTVVSHRDCHTHCHPHRPSPSPSTPEKPATRKKRRRSERDEVGREDDCLKRTRVTSDDHETSETLPREPVAHWVETFTWPKSMQSPAVAIMPPESTKRKSSSTHFSERQRTLKTNGIYMKTSPLLEEASKQLCEDLCLGDHRPDQLPGFPFERIDDVLDRLGELNEDRLRRDVTPWVVPSAEHLYFSGCAELETVGEEINALWTRCEPMCGPMPKPDFTVGLQPSAFKDGERSKLDNYATPQRPFLFTPTLAFPFLICEAKPGQVGLDRADTQNIHSGSLAVRAILRLYHAAYGRDHEESQALLGRILAFTVSHNNKLVNIYGHYAVASNRNRGIDGAPEEYEYFRHDIVSYSLTMYGGRERYKAYNFVRNLYDIFAPDHLGRIQDAVGRLPSPAQRVGRSITSFDLALDDEQPQQDSGVPVTRDDDGFAIPGGPASVSFLRDQVNNLLVELQKQREESERQREESEQQRKDSSEQMDKLLKLLEQQRQDREQ